MKDIELQLIAELMKNSRRSDRDLAKTLKVSQPTVTRLRSKLEKGGIIKEYTMLPDFSKLGFNLLSIIMFKLKPLTTEDLDDLRKAGAELENRKSRPYLMVMSGIGLGKSLAILSFHRDYGAYAEYIREIKNAAYSRKKSFMDVEETESFLIDLNYEQHYQPITFSRLAAHFQKDKT